MYNKLWFSLSWENVELTHFYSLELSFYFVLFGNYPLGESFCLTQGWYGDIQPSGGLIFRVHCRGGGVFTQGLMVQPFFFTASPFNF